MRARALAVILVTAAALAACGGAPRPAQSRPGQSPPGPVSSLYEQRTGDVVSRDCGYSSPLPGRPGWSLWLFCDTEVLHGRRAERLILGADTAAAGPYSPGFVPSPLSEIPTPPSPVTLPDEGPPAAFTVAPGNLWLPGGAGPCAGGGAYAAAWISGVTRAPVTAGDGNLLITFDDYCVTPADDGLTAEGFGIAAYDPADNVLGPVTQVFSAGFGQALAAGQVLGSPDVPGDGYLYLFSDLADLARVPAAPTFWDNPLDYQYWTGAGWSSLATAAVPVIPGTSPGALGVSVDAYPGRGLVLIEQTSLTGGFTAWQAQAPSGPWRRLLSARVPCDDGSRLDGLASLCRALIGHPELSTRSSLMISYYNPGNEHVDVSAFPW